MKDFKRRAAQYLDKPVMHRISTIVGDETHAVRLQFGMAMKTESF